ncbi:MAG: BREX-1 system phosphatase PglZ type A [Aminobacterium colombiense]|jgi:uncharacterized protein (TIGR02687 family)|uniref:BREX-1 system phosphatase PglZ type A n=1 Tax=Aminobacterium colombiense TaxID=81468 RepID=UPI003D980392
MSRIQKYLQELFRKERIVFWYDSNRELQDEFSNLNLDNVNVVEVANNEFGVKRRILKEDPEGKFLLYFLHEKPEDRDNWLLDLLLANCEFHTDHSSVILQDLGLHLNFKKLVEEHTAFFRSTKRSQDLKDLLTNQEDEGSLRFKMLAVICETAARLDEIILSLIKELAEEREDKWNQINNFNLEDFFWEEIEKYFGYRSDNPSLMDFVFSLFLTAYRSIQGGALPLSREALILMNRWKDSASGQESFKKLSAHVAGSLNITEEIKHKLYLELLDLDIYEAVDKQIILDLIKSILLEGFSSEVVGGAVEKRKNTLWYDEYKYYYLCLKYGSEFLENLKKLDLTFSGREDAFRKYTSSYYKQDQLYRKFVYYYHQTGAASILQNLYSRIHNLYSNSFLLTLNDNWQQHINSMEQWKVKDIISQQNFYNWHVKHFSSQGKKIFVVVSDALRYEVASELQERLLKMDRYQADLKSLCGVLPSYTQLGMAALLPHEKLAFSEDFSHILADGRSTQGLANRKDILIQKHEGKVIAIRAEDFLSMNTQTDGRQLSRDHDVIYIFHNGIDKTGDARESEHRVFDAVEEEFEILLRIIKKITNVNGNNILITSDHGFIYQDKAIEESDFATYDLPGGAVAFNRRYVIGDCLEEQPAFKKFTASQLGLDGKGEVLIPKSINRLRVQGAGSRYVHGGASLQEIVIPVLIIKKQRTSDVSQVEVEVIHTSRITSRQPALSLYQSEPVGEKTLPRELRIGFYSLDGRSISEVHNVIFESAEVDGRAREKKLSILFSREADEVNNQEVILKLEEQAAPGVSQYRLYKEYRYSLTLPFEADFEDF